MSAGFSKLNVRFLYLNPIANIGGAERVLLTALAGIQSEFPQARIGLITFADGPLQVRARELGIDAEIVPLPDGLSNLGDSQLRTSRALLALRGVLRLPAFALFLCRLRVAIGRFNPDLVHSNGIKSHLFARYAVCGHIPVVWHLHDYFSLRPVARWLLRRACRHVRAAIAISKSVASDARGVLPEMRIEVVPNAIDLSQFSPGAAEGAELDRRSGLPPCVTQIIRVGLVATYARWKGHVVVLDAAARLAAESPKLPIRWYIVGGPIYHTAAQFSERELQEGVQERGLADRIAFVPFSPDPAPIYRALDIVIHASTQPEPFGLTIAEAMACGRAVIVSAGGGATELFTDGVDAIGIEPGNAAQLAAAVRKLAEDPSLRARLGASARQTAEARFDANRYGERLGEVYRSIFT